MYFSLTSCREENASQRDLQISIVHHNHGVVPTELQNRPPEPSCDRGRYALADRGAARERDEVQALVVNELLAHDGSGALAHGRDAAREVVVQKDLGDEFGLCDCRQTRAGGTLTDTHTHNAQFWQLIK